MKTTYNKSEIMKEAHRLYKSNNRFGWSFCKSLSVSWSNAKQRIINAEVKAKNEAIQAIWKAEHEAKLRVEIETENKSIKESGLSLHEYTMFQYYNRDSYTYYGD